MACEVSVFKRLLGVNGKAALEDVTMSQDDRGVSTLTFDVRPYRRFQNICPHCGRRCPGYDAGRGTPRLWRGLDFGGVIVQLRYAVPRIQCPEHGVVTAQVPWAFHDSGFTREFDLQVAWLAKYLARSSVTELMRIDWKTVGRCVDRAFAHLDPKAAKRRLDGLVRIGVDETSYRKGHQYMTVVVNHDTGEVVWVHDAHGKSVFEAFFKELSPEQRSTIKFVSADGARWVDECIQKYVPEAVRCVDPFHVVEWAGEALDELRTEIWRTLRSEGAELAEQIDKCKDDAEKARLKARQKERQSLAKSIKGSTYTLGKAPENLTPAQSERLKLVAGSQPRLYRAYGLKEELRQILKLRPENARECLQRWYWKASHSRIEAFKDLARKIKRHFENILNSIVYGLSNARIEAVNNKIKLTIRRAYGFRNLKNMFSFVMLSCSKVQIPLPNRPQ